MRTGEDNPVTRLWDKFSGTPESVERLIACPAPPPMFPGEGASHNPTRLLRRKALACRLHLIDLRRVYDTRSVAR